LRRESEWRGSLRSVVSRTISGVGVVIDPGEKDAVDLIGVACGVVVGHFERKRE
jgi:hypothetical protein